MTSKNFLHSFFIVLTSMWLGWTVFMDVFVIRTVFSMIDDFFLAGDLGIAVFTKLNNLELVTASSLLALISWKHVRSGSLRLLFLLGFISWLIAMSYFSYLTPKLVELTGLWQKADLMGLTSVAGISDIQQEHQFYHKLYIGLDVVKVALLTAMLFLGIWKPEKWQ